MLRKLLFFTIFLFATLNTYNVASAVALNSYKIYLFENGIRVKDSSVIYGEYNYDPVCRNGVCNISSAYSTVTFYKTSNANNFNYGDWIDNWYLTRKGCEGFVTQKTEIRDAMEEWRNSEEVEEIQKKVDATPDSAERKKLWDAGAPQRTAFMKSKGFYFYDDPNCNIKYSEYEGIYLPEVKKSALYTTSVTMPVRADEEECGFVGCKGGIVYNVDLKTGLVTEAKEGALVSKLRFFIESLFVRLLSF